MSPLDSIISPVGLFEKLDKDWVTTRDAPFLTRYGIVPIPAGERTDLFSCVPDTEHPEIWLSSLLHDFTIKHRKRLGWTLSMCHTVFRDEMTFQAYQVYRRILTDSGSMKEAMTELWNLNRRAYLYYRGVSGILGNLYLFFTGG